MSRYYIIICIYFLVAGIIQIIFGNMDLAFMAFPVNAAVAAFIAVLLFILNREYGKSKVISFLASLKTTAVAIPVFAACCLVIALFPKFNFTTSYIFNASLLLISVNLFLSIIRYKGRFGFRFMMNHVGIIMIITALSLGSADLKKLKVIIYEGQTVDMAYDGNGTPCKLDYEISLARFEASFYEDGTPSSYSARISAGGREKILEVNSPWAKSWKEDIYISGYEPYPDGLCCFLEIVIQPWKYMILAGFIIFAIGSVMMIFGGKYGRQRT